MTGIYLSAHISHLFVTELILINLKDITQTNLYLRIIIYLTDRTHKTQISKQLLDSFFFLKQKLPNTNTWTAVIKICQRVRGGRSNGSPYFLKKTASICHCTVYSVLHYVISHYCIQNTQINSSPGSSKQPDSLGLMAVKESRGDRRQCSKSSVSIF